MKLPRTIAESVYRRLSHKLARGEFLPGQRISEAEVAETFRVGRGPARESTLRLVSEGVLTKNGAYGPIYVRCVEEDDREQVTRRYELREVIEGQAAHGAADNMTRRPIRELRKLKRRVLEAVTTGDREARLDACLQFRRFLLSHCGNDLLLEVAERCVTLPMRARSPELDENLWGRAMPRGRRAIWLTSTFQAIAQHGADKAERSMRAWLRAITATVREGTSICEGADTP